MPNRGDAVGAGFGARLLRRFGARGVAGSGDWIEAGLYAICVEHGTYAVLKILKIDDAGVHVRQYGNLYRPRPGRIDESALSMSVPPGEGDVVEPAAHRLLTRAEFSMCGPVFVQMSRARAEDCEGGEAGTPVGDRTDV